MMAKFLWFLENFILAIAFAGSIVTGIALFFLVLFG